MLNWILPTGWILLLMDPASERVTCKDESGSIIVIDMLGV
jgi:hypothetical protein